MFPLIQQTSQKDGSKLKLRGFPLNKIQVKSQSRANGAIYKL